MSGTFVVTARSDLPHFPGLHVCTCHGGIHPARGDYARLSAARIREMVVEFATADLAEAEAQRRNANPARLWTYEAKPTAEIFPSAFDAA
jgi:hypothetical protein